jgi:hypothetical protein
VGGKWGKKGGKSGGKVGGGVEGEEDVVGARFFSSEA